MDFSIPQNKRGHKGILSRKKVSLDADQEKSAKRFDIPEKMW